MRGSFRRQILLAFLAVAVLSAGAGSAIMLGLVLYSRYTGLALPNPVLILSDTAAVSAVQRWGAGPVVVTGILLSLLVVLIFAAVLSSLATRRVLRPVRLVSRAAGRVADGDLSVRLQAQGDDELAALVRAFNDMAWSLERQVRRLEGLEAQARRFAGDVSHELRTPIATMTAVADLLEPEADRLSPDAAQAARLIARETATLRELVEDILEMSRFDAGSAALVLDDLDVGELLSATLRRRRWGAPEVVVDVPTGLRARLDPRRIDVVVANLVSNGLRHGAPPIEVRVWTDPDRLVIEVRDHGPGVPAADLAHVFDRFFKGDGGRSRSEGSGLGLAIAAENAALHVGGIDLENHPEGGAVFRVWLRRREPSDDGPPPTP